MATEVEKVRPNIRIEIQNNFSDSMEMEVDKTELEIDKSENEEGEITDDEEDATNVIITPVVANTVNTQPEVSARLWPNTKGVFTTGINIFDKETQEKLERRAKRFALKPEEIHKFSDEDLQILHDSLGITKTNENDVRFEAIHMLGTEEMSTEDVLDYFSKYAPSGIEWIDDNSCNVVWIDNISAARALHFMSKYVRGMPARGPCDPFAKEFIDEIENDTNEEGEGRSILLKNPNREVELKEDETFSEKREIANSVDISEINIPIPPGYWRLGEKHNKSKCILLRFALKTDKKAFRAEKFSNFYKKYGNPNFGGLKGVISESRKRQFKSIFERNRDIKETGKNPWGNLARNWDRDDFREKSPIILNKEPIEIKSSSILSRLGTKRKRDEIENIVQKNTEEPQEKETLPEENEPNNGIKKKPKVPKQKKIPKMRMYADDEEEKIKRKKTVRTIKKRTIEEFVYRKTPNDLRTLLGLTHRKPLEQIGEDDRDLGSKLRNRVKNLVFTIEQEAEPIVIEDDEEEDSKKRVREDIKKLLSERSSRKAEKEVRRKISPPRWSTEQKSDHEKHHTPAIPRSPHRRRRSPTRRPPHHRRSPEMTLHSDRIMHHRPRYEKHSDHHHQSSFNTSYRHRYQSYRESHRDTHRYDRYERPERSDRPDRPDRYDRYDRESHRDVNDGKTRSKVAVVIKTQKRPAVASTVWSKVKKSSSTEEEESSSSEEETSGEEEEEESENSSSSSESSSESEESSSSESESDSSESESSDDEPAVRRRRITDRPGFESIKRRLTEKLEHRSPLKVTMMNDKFRRK